jgi:hypothetical protein
LIILGEGFQELLSLEETEGAFLCFFRSLELVVFVVFFFLEFLSCSDEDEDELFFFVLFFFETELFFELLPFFREEELVVLFFLGLFTLISLSLFSEAVVAFPVLAVSVFGFLLILQHVCLHSALL